MTNGSDFETRWRDLLSQIAANAAAQDRRDGSLQPDIDALRDAGWLMACLPKGFGGKGWGGSSGDSDVIGDTIDALRCIGGANLSVGRLFEGHMNAVKLIDLYARPDTAAAIFAAVSDGAMLGVWGADRQGDPVSIQATGDRYRIVGTKQFASGLGLVSYAVISAAMAGENGRSGTQLAIVPVGDAARQDAAPWQMAGMQATRSGHYAFGGVILEQADLIGELDAYFGEPYFEGGVWRYCAVHIGAAQALYRIFRAHLLDSGRADDTVQKTRLVGAAMAVRTARLWTDRAARMVEAPGAAHKTAIASLMAREATENACFEVLSLVEQGMGMAAHIAGSNVERIRRDLRLYLCQAAPDAKRMRIADALLSDEDG